MTTLKGWLWSPLIALQFLTRIPVRGVPDWAYDEAGGKQAALAFFPAVGMVVATIAAGVYAAGQALGLNPLAVAVLTVTASAMVTGAFHEDGLADVCDGLGPHTREDALRVMRDSRIGTFGGVGLWMLLTLKASAIMSLEPGRLWGALVAAHMLARWSSLPMSMALPYAREAKGANAGIAALVTWRETLIATVITLAVIGRWLGMVHGAMLFLGAVAMAAATGWFYRKKFGGITGDCLGATNQLAEATTLLMAARLLH
ncbi:adenosylcobinamide-GDP ribazoletransferase [Capsulimonas corticalis]|uniref:Adenosylcobinamide-GDP ribazoletransferase n=1 Tax=Capsulimonas corticalis TaxID=2219043 RepID=A0A402D100_9BACT|nr:adenosylcobinamide-GDP ribazoletransferase [Capsulimonas corticalis]BDI31709.1 adenosylcobinamide-GDP ribazoletransferase [Capsulimonas corticalis]